jgi:rubrerythrin
MGKFRESQTAKNLLISYAFESQANTRYTFFADKALADGYIQTAHIFRETAHQECQHALRFFKFFNGGELEVTASFLTGVIKGTLENLKASADLEHYVHTDLYPGFAEVARDEGFDRAADFWDAISIAEEQHEKTFLALADNIETGRIYRRDNILRWRCSNCGYTHTGSSVPDKCPACVKPSGYFEVLADIW